MIRFDLVTSLPGLVRSPLDHSILRRAQDKGLVEVAVHDLRDWAPGRHRQIDDVPYGGMGGMVLKPEPLFACVEALQAEHGPYDEVVFLTPDGETLDQPLANALSLKGRLLLIAGHYKNIDQRVRDALVTREVSVGDYVLSGGELPALVLIDAVARLIPGVLRRRGLGPKRLASRTGSSTRPATPARRRSATWRCRPCSAPATTAPSWPGARASAWSAPAPAAPTCSPTARTCRSAGEESP